ncbi:18943_t:CDS:1, partial [Gigaspora rosea]
CIPISAVIIPTLSSKLPIYPKDKLTSKLFNFKNLSEPINNSSTTALNTLNIYKK